MTNGGFVQVYKSGFLGAVISPLQQSAPVASINTANGIMHQLHITNPDRNDLAISTNLDQMYANFHHKPHTLKLFRYQHELLELSTHLIQSKTLGQWFLKQSQSPLFTQTHKDFLMDTTRAMLGVRRQLSIYSWMRMLRTDDVQYSEPGIKLFPSDLAVPPSTKWSELIPGWLSTETGFNDFVQTMWIMYGSGTVKDNRNE